MSVNRKIIKVGDYSMALLESLIIEGYNIHIERNIVCIIRLGGLALLVNDVCIST